MGLFVQRVLAVGGSDRRAVAWLGIQPLNFGRDIEKLSARKKKPSRGLGCPRETRRKRCSSEWDSRVPNLKFLDPPSALNPQATATASNRVDFPVPFSPTKNVTAGWNSNYSSGRTAASENG